MKMIYLAIFCVLFLGCASVASRTPANSDRDSAMTEAEIAEAKAKIDAYNRENFKKQGGRLGILSKRLGVNVSCAGERDDECYERVEVLSDFLLDNPLEEEKLRRGLKRRVQALWITNRNSDSRGKILWFNPLEEGAFEFLDRTANGY
jgi:hypothetical protein